MSYYQFALEKKSRPGHWDINGRSFPDSGGAVIAGREKMHACDAISMKIIKVTAEVILHESAEGYAIPPGAPVRAGSL